MPHTTDAIKRLGDPGEHHDVVVVGETAQRNVPDYEGHVRACPQSGAVPYRNRLKVGLSSAINIHAPPAALGQT